MISGKTVVLVAAIAENGVIGRNGALPWRLKSDLQHFKKLTLNRPVIMGRKTFEFIGKALKDRTNIVLTRDFGLLAPDAVLATSMDAAFAYAVNDANKRGAGEIMVIGGSDVFEAAMDVADRLEITACMPRPRATWWYFPEIDPQIWRETSRQWHPRGPQDEADFTTMTYERIR